MAIGRPTKRDVGHAADQWIGRCTDISDGIHIGVARLHKRIDRNVSAWRKQKSRFLGQRRFGTNANRQNHCTDGQAFSRFGDSGHFVSRSGFKRCDRRRQSQIDAVVAQLVLDGSRHFCIEQRQHLRLKLDQMNVLAQVCKLFRHFQSDEAGANHQHGMDVVQRGLDPIHVDQVAQRQNLRVIDSRQRRTQRRRTWGQNQLVVGQRGLLTGHPIDHRYGARRSIEIGRFRIGEHAQVQHRMQRRGRLHRERIAGGDFTANVIGQAAVCKAYVGAALDKRDVGKLIEPPKSRRCRCPPGDTAHDHHTPRN
jgi:hypothetical protein